MSHYGQAYSASRNFSQSSQAAAYAPQRMPQQPVPPMGGAAYQQPYKGTLAPGTRVKVGNITVTVKRYLSEGGFAHVYLVTTSQPIPMPSSVTGAIGASMAGNSTAERGETVHVLKRMAVPDKAALADVRREVEVHKLLRNQANIVHFIEASATALQGGGYEIFILMEYCSGGGIISLMNARLRDRLREQEVLKIFGDVCAGLAVMHHLDPPLMHRDLKVENILMAPSTDPGTISGSRSTSSNLKATFKLCDFGSAAPVLSRKPAKSMDEVKRVEADLNKHTTLQYRAPEMVDVYQRRVIDEKADIWALGVLLYKLCYYTTPFEENGGGPLAILNVQYRIPPQPVYSDRLKQLIQSMLKEQSTDRPTIDEVIINVHQILGTRPSQAALHYANAAASGKIAGPVPTLVSGAKLSSASAAPSLPSRAKPAGGIDSNLISMGPSQKELEQAEARELELQKQSITPMRRGRPTKSTVGNSDSPSSTPQDASVKSGSPAPMSPEARKKSSTPAWSLPDPKPTSVKTATLIEGFGDSFTPANPTATESPPILPKRPSPPSVSPVVSGDVAPGTASERAVDKNLLRASSSFDAPSPALSPLRHSPALPGFSVAPSPAASPPPPPPPVKVAASGPKGSTPRDELTDRFPSLEDLDAKYAIPASISPASAPATAPSNPPATSSNHVDVPGLANRASVGAMAGRFERPFEPQKAGSGRAPLSKSATISAFSLNDGGKGRSGSVSKRWQPSVFAHDRAKELESQSVSSIRKSPASRDWLTGDVSEDEEPKKHPQQDEDMKIYATQPRAPFSPPAPNAGKEIEVEEPSSDEEEPSQPEEAVAQRPTLLPHLSTDRLSSFNSRSAPSSEAEEVVNGSESKPERPRITPGRVKAPSWLVDAVDSPTAAERLMSSTSVNSHVRSPAAELVSPITDATAAEQLDEAARQAQDQLEALLRGPADEATLNNATTEVAKTMGEESSPTVSSMAKVKAPAWDEDEGDQDEMSAVPKPSLADKSSLSGSTPENNVATANAEASVPALASHVKNISSSSISSRWNSQPQQSGAKEERQLVDVATSPASPSSLASASIDSVKDRLNIVSLASSITFTKPSEEKSELTLFRPKSIIAQRQAQFNPASSTNSSSASSSATSGPQHSEPLIIQPKRPTPVRPNKGAHLRGSSFVSSSAGGGMKPWEREAALSAAAQKGGIIKNSALPAASTSLHIRQSFASKEDGDDSEPKTGKGMGAVEEDTFSGVSSLISRWQQNVESNAPGWGKIGSASGDTSHDGKAGLGPGLGSKVANHAARFVRERANGSK
ncbi:related to ARK1 - Actin Regulating Kinase [Melanopsichium pennsylvanicum]|uniref:non-specific serine/threonine protein kinase n=2 Tax=Melanopsichium pennsylvanicum TaxID=63383 RepID=A0AAJ4XRS5_9BASI|nr:related to ARK1-Actin Regulating Kinase [Melanopsichium pennsylvanicum 4]SNX87187.1 related to ARK1 - Actin Regulating Kinase [Melanopsichium pennsylvanicum]